MDEQKMVKSQSVRNLCGPFDDQFKRKFLGNRSTSLFSQRKRLLKITNADSYSPFCLNADNLLPKIKQIQKIAKSGGKKHVKKNKNNEVISELQLYLAKKLINNQTTKELISKIEVSTMRNSQSAWIKNQNISSIRKYSQTSSKFYNTNEQNMLKEESKIDVDTKTAYSPNKKWISDQQFKDKFDKFVMKKHEQQTIRLNDLFGCNSQESPEQIRSQIQSDKDNLRDIVKKMIECQNYESEMEIQEPAISKSSKLDQNTNAAERKSIHWILQKCQDFQKSFKIKKFNKSTKRL